MTQVPRNYGDVRSVRAPYARAATPARRLAVVAEGTQAALPADVQAAVQDEALRMAELKVAEAARQLTVKLEPAVEAGYRSERDRLRGQAADWAQTIDGMGKDFQCRE